MLWMTLLAACLASPGCGGGGGGAEVPVNAAPADAGVTQVALVTSQSNITAGTGSGTSAGTGSTPASGFSFSFTLPAARVTSAGVYAADGTLVRTLWRGRSMPAGTSSATWDQRDDAGNLLPSGSFQVRLAHHNLRYVWEGVIGNTSVPAGSGVPHKAYLGPTSLAASAGQVYYAVGYNEGQNGLHGFSLGQPQAMTSPVSLVDPFVAAGQIATDGQRLYWVNAGGLAQNSFIAAFDMATGAQWNFSAGAPACLNTMPDGVTCYAAQNYRSVLERRTNLASPPTGIAVQRNGTVLAVAYGGENAIRLYDKTSGVWLSTLAVPLNAGTTNQIAMAPDGDLWAISGSSVIRFTGLDGVPAQAARIDGLSRPLAVTVDPADRSRVWVADGGSSQQIKGFDELGVPQRTLGLPGGCLGSNQVSDQRLCFGAAPGVEQTALVVDAGQGLWVVDTSNNRMLQWSPDGSMAQRIAYLPAFYASTVDSGNPRRVFANFLEYSVDYTKGLSDPGAWTLVRNWLPTLPAALVDANSANRLWGGFTTVQTMSNGRTYGLLVGASGSTSLVELTPTGVRAISSWSSIDASPTAPVLYENGDLGYAVTAGGQQKVLRCPLQGFDAAGNPVWAAQPTTLATVPVDPLTPAFVPGTFSGMQGPRFPVTASGQVVFFNASVLAGTGFHLGAVAQGSNRWAWQASPSAPLDGLGSFQTRRNDAGLQYGGNAVFTQGRSIVYGYHGEYYTDLGNGRFGEANQFMHFLDDGLFVGQFGLASTRSSSDHDAGLSGNAFSPTLVRAEGVTYLYHNDESAHGGVHRWRLDGIDDIQEISASGSIGSVLQLR